MFYGIYSDIYDWLNEKRFKVSYKPFTPYLTDYTNIDGLKEEAVNYGYTVSKVVIVDLPTRHSRLVDSLRKELSIDSWGQINCCEFRRLPDELCAKTPKEVATIVCLIWDRELVGVYKDYRLIREDLTGPIAYRITCEAVVIDKTKATVVGKIKFRGEDPPEKIPKSPKEDEYGPRPTDQIVEYIKSLSKRSVKYNW
jgi:hypothetical protein